MWTRTNGFHSCVKVAVLTWLNETRRYPWGIQWLVSTHQFPTHKSKVPNNFHLLGVGWWKRVGVFLASSDPKSLTIFIFRKGVVFLATSDPKSMIIFSFIWVYSGVTRNKVNCGFWTKIYVTQASSCITNSLSHTMCVETNKL